MCIQGGPGSIEEKQELIEYLKIMILFWRCMVSKFTTFYVFFLNIFRMTKCWAEIFFWWFLTKFLSFYCRGSAFLGIFSLNQLFCTMLQTKSNLVFAFLSVILYRCFSDKSNAICKTRKLKFNGRTFSTFL